MASDMIHGVTGLSGPNGTTLYIPDGQERSRGILLLHGSEGGFAGWTNMSAFAFAMHGFAAYAFNYGKGGNSWHAGDIHDIDLEKTVEALDWLRSHSFVTGIAGLYGVSRGAEHALLLTSLLCRDEPSKRPDAVAVHSPSDTICGAFISGNYHPKERETWDPSRRAWRWRDSSDDLLPTQPIEIERYSGPLYISHGEDDRVWTVDCTRRLEARLRDAGRRPEVHYYAGEGHGFKPETRKLAWNRLVSFFSRSLKDLDF